MFVSGALLVFLVLFFFVIVYSLFYLCLFCFVFLVPLSTFFEALLVFLGVVSGSFCLAYYSHNSLLVFFFFLYFVFPIATIHGVLVSDKTGDERAH